LLLPCVEPALSQRDQFSVESFLRDAALVSGNQKDRDPLPIERKCNPPNAARRVEAQFLEVGNAAALQRIDPGRPSAGPARLGTVALANSSRRTAGDKASNSRAKSG
jgi:hypothetical protein